MGSIQSRSDTGVISEPTSKWEDALRLAMDCLDVFQRPFENIEDIEKNGKEALEPRVTSPEARVRRENGNVYIEKIRLNLDIFR
jgi:hypothetical protein